MSYLTVILQGCYQVLYKCKKTYFKAVFSSVDPSTSLRIGPTPTSIRPTQPPAGAAVSVCARR